MLMISVDEVMDILEEYAVCTPDEEKSLIQRINQASMFIDNIRTADKWISVKDRLPETCDDVIVCNESGRVYSAWYNSGDNSWLYAFTAEIVTHEVTHWMPLPPKPESEE